jgi:hypothetical protein
VGPYIHTQGPTTIPQIARMRGGMHTAHDGIDWLGG